MYFEKVTQTKPSIVLNHFHEYAPDHIDVKLVPAPQTNTDSFILTFSVLRILKPTKYLAAPNPLGSLSVL